MSGGRVLPFPASDCAHAMKGHCAWEEALNPGYGKAFACPELERMMRRWDGFIDCADRFRLTEEEAFPLWSRLEHGQTGADCRIFRERGQKDEGRSGPCPCLVGNACILLMPLCTGRCVHFRAKGALSHE